MHRVKTERGEGDHLQANERPEIRVSAGLVPPRDCEGEDLSQASHSLVDGHLLPSLSSLCACLCGHISPFYKDTNHIELGLTLIIFILT